MIKTITKIFSNISGSLKTKGNNTWSARKLAALTITIIVVVAHIKWFKSDHWEHLPVVLGADFAFITACLGLTTWQNISDNKKDLPPN